MKTFAKVAAVGVTGVVMIKLLPAMLLSALGLAFGLIALAVKIALVAAIGYFVYRVFFQKDEEALDSDGEIVVEAEIEDDDESEE